MLCIKLRQLIQENGAIETAGTLDGWKKHSSRNGFALSFCQLQNHCKSLSQ